MASSGFRVLVFRQALRFGSTTTMSMPMSSSPLPLRLSGDLFPYKMYSSSGVRFSSSSSGASHPPPPSAKDAGASHPPPSAKDAGASHPPPPPSAGASPPPKEAPRNGNGNGNGSAGAFPPPKEAPRNGNGNGNEGILDTNGDGLSWINVAKRIFHTALDTATSKGTVGLIAFFMGRRSKSPEEPKSSESAKESAKVGADGVGLRVRVASHSYMEVTSGVHMFFVLMSGMAAEDIHFALEQDSGILWVRLDAHRRDYTAIEDGLAAYRCRFSLPETVSGTPTCHVRMERGSLKIVINEIDGTFCMKVPKCTEKNEFRFGDFPGVPF